MSAMTWIPVLAVGVGGILVLPTGCTSKTEELPDAAVNASPPVPPDRADETATAPALPPTRPPADRNNLEAMDTAWLTLKGRRFLVWLAITPTEQMFGLMQVTSAQMTPLADGTERGMLFVFPDEAPRGFWMYNTITPLDIAYLAADGTIVKTHTMPPLTTQTFPSIRPAQFALEMNAGLLGTLDVQEGDKMEIPEAVLKTGR